VQRCGATRCRLCHTQTRQPHEAVARATPHAQDTQSRTWYRQRDCPCAVSAFAMAPLGSRSRLSRPTAVLRRSARLQASRTAHAQRHRVRDSEDTFVPTVTEPSRGMKAVASYSSLLPAFRTKSSLLSAACNPLATRRALDPLPSPVLWLPCLGRWSAPPRPPSTPCTARPLPHHTPRSYSHRPPSEHSKRPRMPQPSRPRAPCAMRARRQWHPSAPSQPESCYRLS